MIEGKGDFSFDAGLKEYVDLVEAGIIDATKVVRIALENAVSVASVLLLTEATMTEILEPSKERALETGNEHVADLTSAMQLLSVETADKLPKPSEPKPSDPKH